MKTKFDSFWLSDMRKQAQEIAIDIGFTASADIDSFRHAYTAAKMNQRLKVPLVDDGNGLAGILGIGNEVLGFSNSLEDHAADLMNNQFGMQILVEVERDTERLRRDWDLPEGEVEILKERLLRMRIAQKVKDGTLNQKPLSDGKKIEKKGSQTKGSGNVFVHAYDQKDGPVKEHYRSKSKR